MKARVACSLGILALMALPVQAQGLATESLSATGLTVTPQIGYERAVLRISGPDGYQGKQRFEAGASIQVDLSALNQGPTTGGTQGSRQEAQLTEPANLPDGRYKYEVVFWAEGVKVGVHSGTFFVEGGVAVSREAKQSQFAEVREDLARQSRAQTAELGTGIESGVASGMPETLAESDWIAITDGTNDGLTYLSLDSDSPSNNQYFLMANNLGDFVIAENDTFTYTSTLPRMSVERVSGEVGIGTTAPGRPLHVVSPSFQQLQLSAGYSGFDFNFNVGNVGLFLYDDQNQSIARFHHAAPTGSLVVNANGIGIGALTPAEDLHVLRPDPQILVESSSGTVTGRTMFYMKNSGNVQFFFENMDSGDIWQMSQLSSVFQISSPSTGLGKFRVRKNGGLQALTGSSTIFDLNSAGDLTVRSVTQTSSRDAKHEFEAVDSASVLEKVASLPISEWSYKAEASVRHLGPMSEDFHAAFGLGKTDKGLTSVDTSGVALAAIQGLIEENARLEERISELEELVRAMAEH